MDSKGAKEFVFSSKGRMKDRSRQKLSNEYLVTKINFDPTENEPGEVCPLSAYRSTRFTLFPRLERRFGVVVTLACGCVSGAAAFAPVRVGFTGMSLRYTGTNDLAVFRVPVRKIPLENTGSPVSTLYSINTGMHRVCTSVFGEFRQRR